MTPGSPWISLIGSSNSAMVASRSELGEGEFQVFCSQMLTAHLGRIRSLSLANAELSAFNERREVDDNALVKAAYDQAATGAPAQ